MYQRVLIALEIAQQRADVPLKMFDAGHVTQVLALRPAAQRRELAPASPPAAVPQAPLGPLQATDRLIGEMVRGGAGAKAAGGLQRVLEMHREMPPVQHHGG